jgi:NADH-quinone oxidoreductase subunit H
MNAELGAISPLAAYLGSFLSQTSSIWLLLLFAIMMHWFVLLAPPVLVMSYLDRKLGADIQMRIGPNRVSLAGLLQGLADVMKSFFKEDGGPNTQDGGILRLGVIASTICLIGALSIIPMAESWALVNLDSGIVWIIGALIFSNLCLFWAAYSAESQWSVLSAYRVLSMISAYTAPIAVAAVVPILIAGGPNLDAIVRAQGGAPWKWIVCHDPGAVLSCVAFYVALLVWQGRAPFDHSKAFGEIAGGFESEYSGLRRNMIGLLEYVSMFLASALIVTLYLGGWRTPFNLESFGRAADLVQWLVFLAKTFALVFISIWVRWSLPRMRIDQIVGVAWRVLVPLGILGAFLTASWLVFFNGRGLGDFL